MDVKLDSLIQLDIKQLSMETLARFLAYHAPSIDLLIPAKLIEQPVNFKTDTPLAFKEAVKQIGFRISSEV
jgi:hypothetical protein